jgi:hypothetical protein
VASNNKQSDMNGQVVGNGLNISSTATFGPGFPGKVWFMVFAQCATELGFMRPQDMPTRRSDSDGNIWQVVRDRGLIRVLKHVSRVRTEAAEVEIGSIKSALPHMLANKRALEHEAKRRKAAKAPAEEIEKARQEYEFALREVRQALSRHADCAELIQSSTTQVFEFQVDAIEKLIFGDVPIEMRTGPGPRMDVQPIRLSKEEDGLEEWYVADEEDGA